MPNVPLNVRVNTSRLQLSAPCTLSVSWDIPGNSKKFDLDHLKVHIMLPEPESYIAIGTSMEPEYHFHSESITVPPQSSIHITVAAISKCSQQSLSGPLAVELGWREVTEKTVFTNVLDALSKTDTSPKEYKDNNSTNGNVLKLISKPGTFNYFLLIIKIFKVIRK